jgi:hypothetical protein
MHITLQQVVIILGSGATMNVLTSAVSALPSKDVPWDRKALKGFIFDFAHLVMSTRRPTQ